MKKKYTGWVAVNDSGNIGHNESFNPLIYLQKTKPKISHKGQSYKVLRCMLLISVPKKE